MDNKVGEVNFKKFKTEFFVTAKTEEFLKRQEISLACLLPEGWFWYEVILFGLIDDGKGIPDKKYGKRFKVTYNGIVKKRAYKDDKMTEKGFSDKISKGKRILLESDIAIKNKDFLVRYTIVKG